MYRAQEYQQRIARAPGVGVVPHRFRKDCSQPGLAPKVTTKPCPHKSVAHSHIADLLSWPDITLLVQSGPLHYYAWAAREHGKTTSSRKSGRAGEISSMEAGPSGRVLIDHPSRPTRTSLPQKPRRTRSRPTTSTEKSRWVWSWCRRGRLRGDQGPRRSPTSCSWP